MSEKNKILDRPSSVYYFFVDRCFNFFVEVPLRIVVIMHKNAWDNVPKHIFFDRARSVYFLFFFGPFFSAQKKQKIQRSSFCSSRIRQTCPVNLHLTSDAGFFVPNIYFYCELWLYYRLFGKFLFHSANSSCQKL